MQHFYIHYSIYNNFTVLLLLCISTVFLQNAIAVLTSLQHYKVILLLFIMNHILVFFCSNNHTIFHMPKLFYSTLTDLSIDMISNEDENGMQYKPVLSSLHF